MKTHQRNGFTLIELIVVIAILAILALLIVPQVTGYTKQSQAAVCKNNMATIIREYTYDYLMPDPDNPFVLTDHISAKNDICPAGGTITYQVDKVNHVLTLSCSEHGSLSSTDLAFSSNVIENLSNITRKTGSSKQSILQYFQKNPDKTIDSEAISQDKSTVSLTDTIKNYLSNNHLTSTSVSWQIGFNSKANQYYITVTSRQITESDASKSVTAVQYIYSADGTFLSTASGTAAIKQFSKNNVTYPMIDKFTAK